VYPFRTRTLALAAALALPLAAFAALGAAAPAYAASVNYAALGDSYSSGVGTNNYDPASGSCERSPQAYAPLWAAAHAVASFDFAACGGATTDDVRASQLSGLSAATTLVSITIGGNDAGFADVVTTCQLGTDGACDVAVAASRAYATAVLPGKLDQTYAAIRAQAPNARLVVLGYPRLFELTSSCGLLGMSLHKRTTLDQGADALDAVIAGRAAAAGATFVDARSYFAGHGICASTAWINGLTVPVTDSFHPKASGYRSAYLPALTSATG
jgi:lysophospholipase L1-like esterase